MIHFDADHNIHCLVAGRKDFMMVHPDFAPILNLTKVGTSVTRSFSHF